MIPQDVGLPAKFEYYRPNQESTILDIASSDRRFSLLSGPTGSGKSAIYMSVAQLLGLRTLVLTSTKGLQAQLLQDFGCVGLTDIRGQSNYSCIATQDGGVLSSFSVPVQCNDGPCHIGVECPLKGAGFLMDNGEDESGCLYRDAVRRARQARLVVTNYAYWMTINRYAEAGTLGEFGLIVLDEAHTAPDELAGFCSVEIGREEVKALLGLTLPPLNEGTDTWVEWAKMALVQCRNKWATAYKTLAETHGDRKGPAKTVKRLTELGHKLKDLAAAHAWRRSDPVDPNVFLPGAQTDWVAESTAVGALFSPVWAHAYAEDYLFKGTPRVVLASAVLQKSAARYLGIGDDNSDFIEMGSSFDPARRPLIYVPTTRVDKNMVEGQTRQWVNRIDEVIGGRLDRKGIIHTRSYDRMRDIVRRSKYSRFMISHTARTTRDAVQAFKSAKAPCILVSPSVEEGYDFAYDAVRYQILAKVPFIDMRSLLMQARCASDKNYSDYLTALSIIQQVGRGMRAEDDWCETLILDEHWAWAKNRFIKNKLLPQWFTAACITHSAVPAAMVVSV